ncbi:chymotrypsin family serine protease [Oerskovia merdavium]|uniref:Uncharacterized protein n=1 Tax=Oerskovia merdavium TaxID=2762227 RepID=A0ABR8U3X6_9CELL|nr:hypothetical protein [Oerskovia merdavium]MBD7982737.1 hypothetical protein [Oerskovia merdavium]
MLLSATLVATAQGTTETPLSSPPSPTQAETVSSENVTDADAKVLTAPPVDENMARLASELTGALADDSQFASAEVTLERDKIIVHWHGAVTNELQQILDREPAVPVEIAQTPLEPGAVRDLAQRILKEDSSVTSVSIPKDASYVNVTSATPPKAKARSSQSSVEGIPIRVSDGGYIGANSRQTDTGYHFGGARISRFSDPFITGNCTSGFAVRKLNDPSKHGMMFAAHCGATGSQWISSDGTYAYPWGPITQRTTPYDGAIMESGFSNPYIWMNAWNASVYAQINGVANHYVGQELCYSGSFSGLVCGNIVVEPSINYNLGGDLTSVTGFVTVNNAGTPAAGNGDSGGPGYQLVNTSTGLKRYAVGIISAIPADAPPVCTGVAGSSTRACSPTVVTVSVNTIAAVLGWYVPTS